MGIRRWGWAAPVVGVFAWLVSGVMFLPLLFESYQVARGSDGCPYRQFDIPWDETWALEGVYGGFSWWPTGLTCTFPIRTGGEYVVTPDPAQSIQLVVAIALAAIGAVAFAVAAVWQVRRVVDH